MSLLQSLSNAINIIFPQYSNTMTSSFNPLKMGTSGALGSEDYVINLLCEIEEHYNQASSRISWIYIGVFVAGFKTVKNWLGIEYRPSHHMYLKQ